MLSGELPSGALPLSPHQKARRRSFVLQEPPPLLDAERKVVLAEESTSEFLSDVKNIIAEAQERLHKTSDIEARKRALFGYGLKDAGD